METVILSRTITSDWAIAAIAGDPTTIMREHRTTEVVESVGGRRYLRHFARMETMLGGISGKYDLRVDKSAKAVEWMEAKIIDVQMQGGPVVSA